MRVLLCGFEPFGDRVVNNAWEVAKAFESFPDVDVLQLPVSFKKAHEVVFDAMRRRNYDLVIMMGETSFTVDYVRLERLAINYMDSTRPDNEGYVANDEELVSGAPKAYFTTLSLKKLNAFLKELGYKVKITNSTGTFVCNSLYYHVLRYLDESNCNTPALFLHLPVATNIVSIEEMKEILVSIVSYFKKNNR